MHPRRAIFPIAVVATLFGLGSYAAAGVSLTKVSGLVQFKPVDSEGWQVVRTVPVDLREGDAVRTALRAQATLLFQDGSRVELAANSSFIVDQATSRRSTLNLTFGALKAWVQHLGSRRFEVRTPTAVCSVRGTEFGVQVLPGGRTVVDLYKGLLGVEDRRGQQVLLHPNERVQVDLRGMGTPGALPNERAELRSRFHTIMQREMALTMSKEQVMAAAVNEIKTAEFQQGKSLIDVFGKRVRLEEYIVRPQPDQFKLVVLNSRADRFDYFYYLGTFNTTLPSDLTVALRQINGTVGTAPTYWLTAFQTGRSNTQDSVVEMANGGHPVDINNNGVASDAVTQWFDPSQNKYVDVTGKSVYMTLFDNYGLYVNGGLKYGWTGSNITSYASTAGQITLASTNDPITGAALAQSLPARSVSTTFPDSSQIHQIIYESYSDGTFTQWDNYIIDDQGKIATTADFAATAGTTYDQTLLKFNYEQVVTASEFQGRKIDLVVEPKILIQSGLIQ